jgi:hypothetical protein
MRMEAQTIVFLGPSLPRDDARELLEAEYHPPARMGDIYRLLSARVERFVIIDGVFHGVPSVWHREILDAMAEGVEVVGASSMGALRAAELHRFGMHGHGVVFEWFRNEVLDGDDEVALRHGDEETAFRALSDPLVNLRATLSALADDGVIDDGEREALVAWLKALHYPDRSRRALADAPLVRAWPAARREAFAAACHSQYRDVKRDDAMHVLAWCADHPADGRVVDLPDADRPERVMWRIGRVFHGTTASPDGRSIPGEALASRADAWASRLGPMLACRAFLMAWARECDVTCPADVVARERAQWRTSRQPAFASDAEFLAATGLTMVRANQLLAERALAAWLIEEPPSPQTGAPDARSWRVGVESPLPDGRGAYILGSSAALNHPSQLDDRALAIVEDWARSHGIAADPAWMIEQGPAHFGLAFHASSALVEELRLTGDALTLAAS